MRSLAACGLCLLTVGMQGCTRVQAARLETPQDAPLIQPRLTQLQQDITTAASGPGVQHATWGIVVESLDRGERLFELNPRTLLVPASVAKLVTLATAVEAVGWDYRYETTLETNGTVIDGVLDGDLVVRGAGDPAIGGRAGDDLAAMEIGRAHV